MIPVPPLTTDNEPPLFDKNCRQPGNGWLRANPDKDPHEQSKWWRDFQPVLAKHFEYRCGWLATCILLDGTVDHMLACGPRQGDSSPHRNLAFEWTNFRYAAGTVYSLKGTVDDEVIDPCEVRPGWFRVAIPSFLLLVTDQVPPHLRKKAGDTVKALQLNGFKARFTRWHWYRGFRRSAVPNLPQLRLDAPLVAEAVEQALAAGEPLPDPDLCEPERTLRARQRRYGKRQSRPSSGPAPTSP